MHYLNALVLMLSILCTAALSAPLEDTLPDNWFAYYNIGNRTDLRMIELPDGTVTTPLGLSRTDVTVCDNEDNSICHDIYDARVFARTIGSMIKGQSDDNDCGDIKANVGKYTIEYHATGRNCDTTAEWETISGALYHYFTSVLGNRICGNTCLKLDHGGTWRGYLKIAHTDHWSQHAHCYSGLDFQWCASGGGDDI
ncbi:hypothetical protein BDW62DRAFT_203706 [Aspergillus aurantiobrunneus]